DERNCTASRIFWIRKPPEQLIHASFRNGETSLLGDFFFKMVSLVNDQVLKRGQNGAAAKSIREQQRVIDDDDVCSLGLMSGPEEKALISLPEHAARWQTRALVLR